MAKLDEIKQQEIDQEHLLLEAKKQREEKELQRELKSRQFK